MSQHPVFPIAITDDAQLLLCPCPGTKDADLSSSLQQLSQANSGAVLTAMTSEELAANGVDAIGKTSVIFDMQWFHLPIEDDTVPGEEWEARFQGFLPRFKQLINSGVNLAIHCKGGSGRTGLIAARLLLEYGVELDEAIARIRTVRPNAFNLEKQQSYIAQFAK
ncbi:dual specificity protein phosphatase family protein [Aliagarivorans taiwanensis]|uniref:phosphatase domain-containing putative toxin n=1 Tax=Aliagarivorans taiwanensis TaxID=561966 RepID=UPI000409CBF7|nr:dual specificity protein phosphatase family protein [Aliagarivorans taiwanensis]